MVDFLAKSRELFPYTQKLRREFHRHPELGFQEIRTARRIAEELGELPGLDVETGVGGTGVVALLEGGKPGPVAINAYLIADTDSQDAVVIDPGGSYETLMNSISQQVLTLPDDVRILSGHGPETTVGKERRGNMYLG